jgi:hypothetical protein
MRFDHLLSLFMTMVVMNDNWVACEPELPDRETSVRPHPADSGQRCGALHFGQPRDHPPLIKTGQRTRPSTIAGS